MTVKVGLMAPYDWMGRAESVRQEFLAGVAAGVDHLAIGDHVSFHGGWGLDGLVNAAAVLGAHPSLPVYLSVYLLTARHPVLVARQLSTLAALGPGRLTLAVGIGGDHPAELTICGVDPRTRGRRANESLEALRLLLTGEPVSFQGEIFRFDDAVIQPAPSPSIPIIIGGRSEAALRRTARFGDGWLGIWVSPRRFGTAVREVAEEAGRIGRNVAWSHGLTAWYAVGESKEASRKELAHRMEELYRRPFGDFERFCPHGRAEDVAEFLASYVAAGCTTINLIPGQGEVGEIINGAAEVARLLKRG